MLEEMHWVDSLKQSCEESGQGPESGSSATKSEGEFQPFPGLKHPPLFRGLCATLMLSREVMTLQRTGFRLVGCLGAYTPLVGD